MGFDYEQEFRAAIAVPITIAIEQTSIQDNTAWMPAYHSGHLAAKVYRKLDK